MQRELAQAAATPTLTSAKIDVSTFTLCKLSTSYWLDSYWTYPQLYRQSFVSTSHAIHLLQVHICLPPWHLNQGAPLSEHTPPERRAA
jgi:hypothetical protein